jgi:hypothetical protein
VVGIDEDFGRVESATSGSISRVAKHLEGSDFDEAEREAREALAQQERSPAAV